MGLDIVELVIEVESVFGVAIPDADARQLRTVGMLYDYIAARVLPDGAGAAGGSYQGSFWEQYLDVLEREIGAERAALRPDAAFVKDLRMD